MTDRLPAGPGRAERIGEGEILFPVQGDACDAPGCASSGASAGQVLLRQRRGLDRRH